VVLLDAIDYEHLLPYTTSIGYELRLGVTHGVTKQEKCNG
jgi:hypothetical protein